MKAARHFALIPAAGSGSRLGAASPKQYLQVAGKPMLRHVLDNFATHSAISHTYVVVHPGDQRIAQLLADAAHLKTRVSVLFAGGASRQETVHNGLQAMRAQVAPDDWVLVHDAARPGLTAQLIDLLIASLVDDPVGGLLALPVVDTLKRAKQSQLDSNLTNPEAPQWRAQKTLPREQLWAAQTPQMFRYGLLNRALGRAQEFTDESSAIEALGLQPKLILGSPRNFKITLPQDVQLAELYLQQSI